MSELRSELWEKEMKLTDIRLEALNSAHQLDQLRETMHNMQVGPGRGGAAGGAGPQNQAGLRGAGPRDGAGCGDGCGMEHRTGYGEARGCRMGRDVGPWLRERCTAGRVCRTLRPRLQTRLFSPQLEVDLLKAENDRLKVAPGPSAGSAPGQIPGSSALPSPRRSLGLALTHSFSPSLTDTGTCWGEGPGRVKSRKGSPSLTPAQLPGSGGTGAAASRGQRPETRRIAVLLNPLSLFGLGLLVLLWAR